MADTKPFDHREALKTTGIEQLSAPGTDTNYLDWAFVVKLHLAANDLSHVLVEIPVKDRPSSWIKDNLTVNSIFSKTIHKANMRYVRDHEMDARSGWEKLKAAHQDSSSGGRMFWLRKLILCRMEDEDMERHIERMNVIFERLNSLITADNPLTADDIYATALLISLPTDWLPSVTHLLNRPQTTSLQIVTCLKNEATRRSSSLDFPETTVTASRAYTNHTRFSGRPSNSLPHRTAFNPDANCSFCMSAGHEIADCRTAQKVLAEHKRLAIKQLRPATVDSRPSSSNRHTKASKTQVVSLGSSANDEEESSGGDETSDDSTPPTRAAVASTRPKQYARTAVIESTQPGPRFCDWTIDSACSKTMQPSLAGVNNRVKDKTAISLADDSTIVASHAGTISLPIDGSPTVKTLVVPQLHDPLLSVAELCDGGHSVLFTSEGCEIFSTKDVVCDATAKGSGYRNGNLYYLPMKVPSAPTPCYSAKTVADASLLGYHRRFNHIGLKALKRLLRSNGIVPTTTDEIAVQRCDVCVRGKMHRLAFKSRRNHRAVKPGQMIHSDVGSFEVTSREGYRYFITFVDDFSKSVVVYPMKCKSDSFQCFKLFRASFEKTGSHTILSLTTDNGGEYISTAFEKYLRIHGIEHVPGPPHTPELNGVAERANRTIGNLLRCSLIGACLPKAFWADALRHSFHAYNSYPCFTPQGFQSPNSLLAREDVDLHSLHPFGCLVWYKVPEANRRKLDPKARASILLSYLPDGKGYRVWDLQRRVVVKSRDVMFEETRFPYGEPLETPSEPILVELPWPNHGSTAPAPEPSHVRTPSLDLPLLNIQLEPRFDRRLQASIHNPDVEVASPPTPPPLSPPRPTTPDLPIPTPEPSPPPPRRSARVRKPTVRLGNFAKEVRVDSVVEAPKTWKQLLRSPHKAAWMKAAEDEISSLMGMNTWRLVPRPVKRQIIKSKWIFKVKRKVDATILKLKARLVAMGYSQVKGEDYDEVFAPTLRMETLRLMFTLLASRKWVGRQLDFKTAFLNGSLDETIYMEQPPGFFDPNHPDWVCELLRSLYGLKQSPRQWNKALHLALIRLGLTQSKYDPTLYFQVKDGQLIGALTTHVDDLAVIGTPEFTTRVTADLANCFEISSDEQLHHFLSLKITRDVPN